MLVICVSELFVVGCLYRHGFGFVVCVVCLLLVCGLGGFMRLLFLFVCCGVSSLVVVVGIGSLLLFVVVDLLRDFVAAWVCVWVVTW